MGNYYRDNRSGQWKGNKKFGGKGSRDRYSDRPQMFSAICDECGRECEVPFKPTGNKPVYCSSCFERQGNTNYGQPRDRDFPRSRFDDKKMYQAVCDRCGEECEVPFQPTSGKPVFCSNCFEKKGKHAVRKETGTSYQFEELNTKLDKILQLLTHIVPDEAPIQESKVKKSKARKIQEVAEEKTLVKKKAATKKASKNKKVAKKTSIKKKK